MKNIAKKLLATVLSVALLAGCAPLTKKESSAPTETPKTVEPVDVNVAALKGPTSMGMVQMMKENDEGKITSNNYKFEILSAVDEVTPKIVKGEFDIAYIFVIAVITSFGCFEINIGHFGIVSDNFPKNVALIMAEVNTVDM